MDFGSLFLFVVLVLNLSMLAADRLADYCPHLYRRYWL